MCGVVIGAVPWLGSPEEMIANSGMHVPEMPPGWTLGQMLHVVYGILGGCSSVVGIALLVLAVFVRRGGTAAAVTSIVLNGLVVLILGINVISGLVQSIGNPVVLVGVIIILVPIALFVTNMNAG